MDKKNFEVQLNELKKNKVASKSSRILEILPMIESSFQKGVTYQEIVDLLNANGYEINFVTFRGTLHRLRKRKKKQVAKVVSSAPEVVKSQRMQEMITQNIAKQALQESLAKDGNKDSKKFTFDPLAPFEAK